MTEKTKKIHIELKSGESGITSFAGLWPAVELFRKAGLPRTIDSAVGARSSRGFRDSEHILSLVLLHLSGGSAADHLPFLKEKLSFEKLGVPVPSPSALRKWLNEFHNGDEDGKRGMGKAFIPEENGYLKGLGTVLSRLFAFAVTGAPRKHITLDQDATFIETEESGANWNYKGQKSYQALNTYCPQYDLVAGTRYGDGKVETEGGAGTDPSQPAWGSEGSLPPERQRRIPDGPSHLVHRGKTRPVRIHPRRDLLPRGRGIQEGGTGSSRRRLETPVQSRKKRDNRRRN